jgi:hypothetical protein
MDERDFLCFAMWTDEAKFATNWLKSPQHTWMAAKDFSCYSKLLISAKIRRQCLRQKCRRLRNWTMRDSEPSRWDPVLWYPSKNTSPFIVGLPFNFLEGMLIQCSSTPPRFSRQVGNWLNIFRGSDHTSTMFSWELSWFFSYGDAPKITLYYRSTKLLSHLAGCDRQ